MSTEEQISQIKGVDTIKEFYTSNKKNINIAGIGLFLAMLGVIYCVYVLQPAKVRDAGNSFFTAERYFHSDSLDLALNGDGVNLGMLDIADEFGSTKIGEMASFYAGRIYLEKGQYEDALDYLESTSFGDEVMHAQVKTLIGDCHSELGDYSTAGDKYMKAANSRENNFTTPIALRKAGEAYEEAGEYSDALKAFNRLKEDFKETREAIQVEAKIARVEAKIAAE